MPHPTETILLLDGPISVSGALTRRQRLVSDMALMLLRYDAFRNEADALRCLLGRGTWSTFDVLACLDDARQVAMQETVVKAMADQ